MPTLFVSGTGTEVGKTWYAAALARGLRARGITVRAAKPAQSFEPADARTDAHVLGEATGVEPGAVCPPHRWYPVAYAPPMAAAALGRSPFTVDTLAREVAGPVPDVLLVEGAGGPRSPMAADGDNTDLARAVGAEGVVLVADAGLGTINAVLTCAAAFDATAPVVVALNRFDRARELHRLNRAHLASVGVDTVTSPAALADRVAAHVSARAGIRGR